MNLYTAVLFVHAVAVLVLTAGLARADITLGLLAGPIP